MSSLDRSQAGYLDVDVSTIDEHPDIVKGIFGQCIVMSAVPNVFDNNIRYLLICEGFEALAEDETIPDYSIEVDDDQNVTFTRLK